MGIKKVNKLYNIVVSSNIFHLQPELCKSVHKCNFGEFLNDVIGVVESILGDSESLHLWRHHMKISSKSVQNSMKIVKNIKILQEILKIAKTFRRKFAKILN